MVYYTTNEVFEPSSTVIDNDFTTELTRGKKPSTY